MTSSYTTNKNIEKPAYNDYAANPTGWSGANNTDWDRVDAAFGAVQTINLATLSTTVLLTSTFPIVVYPSGGSASYIASFLNVTGAMAGHNIIRVPTGVCGTWVVYNNTSGAYNLTIDSAGGGASVVVEQGETSIVVSDGTNVRLADSRAPSDLAFPTGTRLLFQQTSAPTGWTKDTTHNNKALRVVSGSVVNGGTVSFTDAFKSQAVGGSVGNTTLTLAQIPAHTHSTNVTSGIYGAGSAPTGGAAVGSGTTGSAGTGDPHTHSFTGTNIDLAVAYVDVIIAQKD